MLTYIINIEIGPKLRYQFKIGSEMLEGAHTMLHVDFGKHGTDI